MRGVGLQQVLVLLDGQAAKEVGDLDARHVDGEALELVADLRAEPNVSRQEAYKRNIAVQLPGRPALSCGT
jgi:hypothetical protein